MELNFNITVNGQTAVIKCNDMFFNYVEYRSILPEQFCLEMIHTIKNHTGKKVAIIWGNCQTGKLQQFLMSNYIFAQNYLVVQIPAVCEYLSEERANLFLENFWSLCDLLISQRISKNNRFSAKVATQNLSARLPEDTKIIWIPNIYFDGYFPQYRKNLRNVDEHIHQSGRFPMGDKYVDKFLKDKCRGGGGIIQELKKFLEEQNFISEDEVKKCVENSFAELKKREWACDIHMLDFVVDNYRWRQIFYSPNHPTQNVIMELAHRVLNFMDISDKSFFMTDALIDERNSLIGQDAPIYPKVKKIIGLQNSMEEYFANRYFPDWTFRANYIDFLIEYAKWCWKDKIVLD